VNTPVPTTRYKNYRFLVEIVSQVVRLYYRFSLRYRELEELLFERGKVVPYAAIRKWCREFGQPYANQPQRRRLKPGAKSHLDQVFLSINGERHYLWLAGDPDGNILDILVQRRRDETAAKTFFRKLLKGCRYVPEGSSLIS
jgi:putative transposase